MDVTFAVNVSTSILLAVMNDAEIIDAVTCPKVTLLAAVKANPPRFSNCAEPDARVGLPAIFAYAT